MRTQPRTREELLVLLSPFVSALARLSFPAHKRRGDRHAAFRSLARSLSLKPPSRPPALPPPFPLPHALAHNKNNKIPSAAISHQLQARRVRRRIPAPLGMRTHSCCCCCCCCSFLVLFFFFLTQLHLHSTALWPVESVKVPVLRRDVAGEEARGGSEGGGGEEHICSGGLQPEKPGGVKAVH